MLHVTETLDRWWYVHDNEVLFSRDKVQLLEYCGREDLYEADRFKFVSVYSESFDYRVSDTFLYDPTLCLFVAGECVDIYSAHYEIIIEHQLFCR